MSENEKVVGKLKVAVESDLSQVTHDMKELEQQVINLSHTVERLNNNGINIKLNIKADNGKLMNLFRPTTN